MKNSAVHIYNNRSWPECVFCFFSNLFEFKIKRKYETTLHLNCSSTCLYMYTSMLYILTVVKVSEDTCNLRPNKFYYVAYDC